MPPETLRRAVEGALAAGHFFVRPAVSLRVDYVGDEARPWEVYRGHLLDAALARQPAHFAAWHLYARDAAAPLVSLRWQPDEGRLHLTRYILTHGFEPYEDTPGVILSRPAQKWVEELVGTIELAATPAAALSAELATLVSLAVVGTSRLPITSLECPLPDYTLGRLAYSPTATASNGPTSDPLEFLARVLVHDAPEWEQVKALETALRAVDLAQLEQLAAVLAAAAQPPARGRPWGARLLRGVFNGAALSPYTQFADALVGLVELLGNGSWFGPAASLDTLGYMLRHLGRHLTAFDLALFHSFGANYPDALFLDALLKAYLRLIDAHADLLAGPPARLRRRALRQAMLLRRQYEGHRVPDAPTSMGENARVLPAPFVRVPEEQIFEPGRRRRTLYAGEDTESLLGPSGRKAFEASLVDLAHEAELLELGLGTFLDRPLGALLEAGAVDRTPLVSYEAVSKFVARRRLAALKSAKWIDSATHNELTTRLNQLDVAGLAVAELSPAERPGVVSLADAARVAADFVLLRTTRSALDALLARYDLTPLEQDAPGAFDWFTTDPAVLFVPYRPEQSSTAITLRAYAAGEVRLELGFPRAGAGTDMYCQRAGVEVPARLHVLAIRRAAGDTLEECGTAAISLAARAPSPDRPSDTVS